MRIAELRFGDVPVAVFRIGSLLVDNDAAPLSGRCAGAIDGARREPDQRGSCSASRRAGETEYGWIEPAAQDLSAPQAARGSRADPAFLGGSSAPDHAATAGAAGQHLERRVMTVSRRA